MAAVGMSSFGIANFRTFGTVSFSGKSMSAAYTGTTSTACPVWNVTTTMTQMGARAHTNRHANYRLHTRVRASG